MIGIHYKIRGDGRDSYIYKDNGGFTHAEVGYYLPPSWLAGGNRVYRKSPGLTNIESRPYHYKIDGTGRDGYIAHNQGGMMSPGHGPK